MEISRGNLKAMSARYANQGHRRRQLQREKGEFVAIVGPSGSGKSTLPPSARDITSPWPGAGGWHGHSRLDQTKLAIFRRRQIGLIYQFYNLIPILNVEAYPLAAVAG